MNFLIFKLVVVNYIDVINYIDYKTFSNESFITLRSNITQENLGCESS